MYINVDSFGVGKETQSLKSQNTTYECMILNSIFVLSRLVRIIIDWKRRKSFIELDWNDVCTYLVGSLPIMISYKYQIIHFFL